MNHQRGFSLLEALISMLVLAVGLLGASNLQSRSYLSTRDAQFRTIASIAADTMAERIVLRGVVSAADRDEILLKLQGLIPNPALDTTQIPDTAIGIEQFAVDVSWTGMDEGTDTIRYIVSVPPSAP